MRQVALVSFVVLCLALPAAAAPFLFATRPGTGDVVAIDLASGGVAGSFGGGSLPSGAALSADGTRLYVADGGGGLLRAIDPATGSVQTIAVGAGAAGVALCPGGARLGVALTQDDALAVVDTATFSVVTNVPVGDQPIAVACGDGFFAVANYGAATVTVVDATTLAVVGTPSVGSFPSGVVNVGARAWVTSLFDSNVTVVNLATATVVNTVPVGSGPRGIATTSGRVFVGNVNSDTLTVLDVVTAGIVGTIPLPTSGPTDVLADGVTGLLYVAHLGEPAITVVDPVSLAVNGTVAAPTGLLALAGVVQAFASAGVAVPFLHPLALALLAVLLAWVALRVRGGLAVVLLAALVAVTPHTAYADPIPFSDSTFSDSDWEIYSVDAGTGSQLVTQSPVEGNPQPSRFMRHFNPPLETVHVLHLWLDPSHDPGTSGPITTIDVSWDRIATGLDCTPGNVVEAFVVYQGGTPYLSQEVVFSDAVWTTASHTGLIASDFDDGGGNSPDFSASGSPLRFGYSRRTVETFEDTRTFCHGIDNLNLVLNAEVPAGETFVGLAELNYFSLVGEDTAIGATRSGDLTNAASVDVRLGESGGPIRTFQWPAGTGGEATVTFTADEIDGDGDDVAVLDLTLFNPSADTVILAERDEGLIYRGTGPLSGLWTIIVLFLARWDFVGMALLGAAALYVAMRRRASSRPATPPASAP